MTCSHDSITGWRGYAVAIGLVALATASRLLLGLLDHGVLYFALFLSSSGAGDAPVGPRPGLVAHVSSPWSVRVVFVSAAAIFLRSEDTSRT